MLTTTTAKTASAGLRTSFKVTKSLESVYSGGPVVISKSGEFIAATREQDIVLYSISQQRIAYILSSSEEDDSDITSLCLRDDATLLVSAHASHQIREWDLTNLIFTDDNNNNNNEEENDETLTAEGESNKNNASGSSSSSSSEAPSEHTITHPTKAWKLPNAYVASMAFDRTGTLLAMGCTDARIRVWEVPHGYFTHSFRIPGGGVVSNLAFCPFKGMDPRRPVLVSVGDDYALRVWDLASKSGTELRGHSSTVSALGFAGDKYVVSAGRDNVIMVWDLFRNKKAATIPAFEGLLGVAAVSKGGKTFLYGAGERGLVKVWSLDAVLAGSSMTPVWVQKDKSSKKNASKKNRASKKNNGGDIFLNDNDSDDSDNDDDIDDRTSYTSVQYSAEADTLLLVTSEQNLYLYTDIAAAAAEGVFLQDTPAAVVGNRDQVADLQYVSQDRVVVVDNSERPQLIDVSTGSAAVLEGHTDLVLCAAVLLPPAKKPAPADSEMNGGGEEEEEEEEENARDPLIATGSKDKLVRLWNGRTGKCLGVFEGHTGSISAVALFGNRSGTPRLLSASNDTTMKLWDIPSTDSSDDVTDDVIDEEAKDKGYKWKQDKSRFGVRAHDKDINSIAVAPNDKVIATGSQDRLVKLWNAETLAPIATLSGHRRGVWSVAFSNIDQVLASASADGTVRLWSLASHQCLKTFEGHSGPVLRCAFATRGMQLLTTGADALVKLWTIKTGECVGTFDSQHSDRIWALALRPGDDGAAFATAGADSVINFWSDCTQEVLEAERAEHDRKILQRHELDVHLRSGEYRKALEAAFSLGHPRQVLRILEALRTSGNGEKEEEGTSSPSPNGRLGEVIGELSEENMRTLMGYVVDWNTSVKHAVTAQAVLFEVFRVYDFERLRGLMHNEPFKKMLEALIPYTQRHMSHCDSLLQRSRIIDYTYASFSSLDDMAIEDEDNVDEDVDEVVDNGDEVEEKDI